MVNLKTQLFLAGMQCCLLLFSIPALAQSDITLSGIVRTAGKPVPAAVITVAKKNTVTDSTGGYRIGRLVNGSYLVTVSHIGYESVSKHLVVTGSRMYLIDFDLHPRADLLNEMVVTGVSKATRVRETPLNIMVVSSRAISRQNESNIIDALVKNVPGLNAVKTGPNISKPFIRGLGYNRILTLYDGIRQEGQQWGDEHGIEVDAYNVERAEVIKGPASLLFGSDALAGVVSLFPWLPKTNLAGLQGRVTTEYQSNNGLTGSGLRLGASNGKWLWAASGSYRIAKNYTNAVDGRVYNTGFREHNAAATLGYTTEKGYSRLSATLYDNLQGIPDGSRDSLTRRFTRQTEEGSADNVAQRELVPKAELDGYSLSPLHQHIQHYRLYNTIHYAAGPGVLETTLGFQQSVRREYSHPTRPMQPGLFVRLNTYNYGVKYLLPFGAGVEGTGGINGMFQQNKSDAATDFPIPDYRLRDIGPYLHLKWKQEKWSVTGGLRYDNRRLTGGDFFVGENPVTGFPQKAAATDSGASLQFARFDKIFRGISLSIGAAYALSPVITLKANVARGYRSPNITEYAANGLDPGAHIIYIGNRAFQPEFSLQEEVGIYAATPGLTASFSIFNNHIRNYIYLAQKVDPSGQPLSDAQGNKTFAYEQSSAQLYGGEWFADWHPLFWKGFHFISSASFIRAFNRGRVFKNKKTDGEYLPLIPPVKWTNSVSRETEPGKGIFSSVSAGIEYEYNAAQNRYLRLYHTETPSPAYGLLNLMLGKSFAFPDRKSLQVQLQVNNLFNTAYQSNLSRLKYFEYYAASPNGRSGIFSMGRNLCLKLITEF